MTTPTTGWLTDLQRHREELGRDAVKSYMDDRAAKTEQKDQ